MADMGLFKERLKIALNEKGWKQIDLSEATGIKKESISKYLSGQNVPRQTGLYIMATSLNVSPAWLMGFDVPMKPSVYSIQEKLINTIKKLPSTEQEKILNIINILYPNIDKEDEKKIKKGCQNTP